MSGNDKKEVVVIGAGPGGYAAAFRAADLGLQVTLIDPEVNPGGVCLYRGCIPSKALLHITKLKMNARSAAKWGMKFNEPEIDIKKINAWKESVVLKLTRGLGDLSESRNIDYIQGTAYFAGNDELQVEEAEGKKYSLPFRNAIIATGSVPVELPDVKFDGKHIISSKEALEIEEIPENMLVIGGGYIGLEMGSVYASLGCKVSIAEMTPGFLPGADRDLVEEFAKEGANRFDELHFETSVEQASVKKGRVHVILKNEKGETEKKFSRVLMAVGRKPNTNGLKLKNTDIAVSDKGFINVGGKRKTTVGNIYAIGDVTGEPMLAHKAHLEGRVAAEAIAGMEGAAFDPKAIPAVVFTHPEIAWSGLTETMAGKRGLQVKITRFPWSASGRAATMGVENGLTKLICDPETGRILGGGAVGENAGSLIPEITLAIEMAATAEDLSLTIHPHPTLSETLMESAEEFAANPIHLMV